MAQSQKDVGQTHDMLQRLQNAGIDREDAWALRRISMTLHRWHELECGDDNGWASVCIARGYKAVDMSAPDKRQFIYDEEKGRPYLEMHPNNGGRTRYDRIPDRERGAQKRLASIMARYPTLTAYVQGDPRGAALYILRPGDIPAGASVDSCYSRGIAVYK